MQRQAQVSVEKMESTGGVKYAYKAGTREKLGLYADLGLDDVNVRIFLRGARVRGGDRS